MVKNSNWYSVGGRPAGYGIYKCSQGVKLRRGYRETTPASGQNWTLTQDLWISRPVPYKPLNHATCTSTT